MKSLRDLLWILPSSLLLGLLLSLPGPGTWWIGWLAYFIILALGLLALSALWRSAGAARGLAWMLGLALVLRLGIGIFFSYVLPVYGDNNEANQAGYIYRDAYTYDTQAWDLAASGDPLWKAFDRSSGIEEQYGGLTFTLSLTYRLLSPDAHRPWLTILLSALMGALGVALAWKGARQAWGAGVALALGWIMALYPESLFSGASQIREPYLLLFIAMLLWAASILQADRQRNGLDLAGRRYRWVVPVLAGRGSRCAGCAGHLVLAGSPGSPYPLVVGGRGGCCHPAGRSVVQPDRGRHPAGPGWPAGESGQLAEIIHEFRRICDHAEFRLGANDFPGPA